MNVINQFGADIGASITSQADGVLLCRRLMSLCGRFPTLLPSRLWVEKDGDIEPLLTLVNRGEDEKTAEQIVAELDFNETAEIEALIAAE